MYSSVFVTVDMYFSSKIKLFCQKIIGQYIAKTYMETKHRPHFIIADTNSEDVVKVK